MKRTNLHENCADDECFALAYRTGAERGQDLLLVWHPRRLGPDSGLEGQELLLLDRLGSSLSAAFARIMRCSHKRRLADIHANCTMCRDLHTAEELCPCLRAHKQRCDVMSLLRSPERGQGAEHRDNRSRQGRCIRRGKRANTYPQLSAAQWLSECSRSLVLTHYYNCHLSRQWKPLTDASGKEAGKVHFKSQWVSKIYVNPTGV